MKILEGFLGALLLQKFYLEIQETRATLQKRDYRIRLYHLIVEKA